MKTIKSASLTVKLPKSTLEQLRDLQKRIKAIEALENAETKYSLQDDLHAYIEKIIIKLRKQLDDKTGLNETQQSFDM